MVFTYSRKKTVNEVDESGKVIPILEKDAEGVEKPTGKFVTKDIWFEDHFNLDFFIRAFTLDSGSVVVLLDDGHEVSQRVPVLKNKNKPPTPANITEEKVREWVQSEILIEKPEEIAELKKTLKLLV